jgi:toxin ParE1/3/4
MGFGNILSINGRREQADRYYAHIMSEIEFIASNLTSGKPMYHVKKNYFASFVKSHMILFKRNKGMVEIIRILHQKMDVESNLD